jgi:fructose-bisphosphate aldolase, class II
MPLIPIPELMRHAREQGYALGYFESWNFESLQGVIDAAEQTRSPIIIGFNGEMLSRPDRIAQERISWYGALGRAAADSASVPCGFIFNECPLDEPVRQAVTAGFNLVMPIPAHGESPSDYRRRTADMVTYAHRHFVAVEAELGELPFGASGAPQGGDTTDPRAAAEFARQTGVDLLAVSVGNVHVLLKGAHELNLDHLAAIHRVTDAPLVLHGGTGISADSIKEAIRLGVTKVNYGTYVKLRYLAAVRMALENPDPNPHHLLGYGGADDVMIAGRRAVCEAVLERIEILNCVGKG